MFIPEYVKRAVGLPNEVDPIHREESGCVCITKPSALEIQQSRRSFINRARALLVSLGLDPTPKNVSRIQADETDPTVLSVSGKFFKVLDNEEILETLELILLSNPERLPPNFLALFFTGAFKREVDFKVIRIVAEALRRANTLDSKWAMHQLINLDGQIKSHIEEVINHVGLETLFHKDPVKQITFGGANYTVVEIQPQNTILKNYEECHG